MQAMVSAARRRACPTIFTALVAAASFGPVSIWVCWAEPGVGRDERYGSRCDLAGNIKVPSVEVPSVGFASGRRQMVLRLAQRPVVVLHAQG